MIRRVYLTGVRFLIEKTELLKELQEEVEKCINCGFCESVCPTLPASGFRSSIGARGRVDIASALLGELDKNGKSSLAISESFYSCLDCFACLQVCPAGVNAGKVSHLGKSIIADSTTLEINERKAIADMIVSVTMKTMNPLGLRRECSKWSSGLEFDSASDTLFYTGNMYQLMPYSKKLSGVERMMGQKATDAMARLISSHPGLSRLTGLMKDDALEREMNRFLQDIYALLSAAKIEMNYLGEDEPYPGTFIFDLGYISEFRRYAERVTEIFHQKGVRNIITVDPHTYDLLKVQYPKYVPEFDFDVCYYTDFLDALEFEKDHALTTLHEPCHFTLREEAYNGPLKYAMKITDVVLPDRSGKKLMCCGGPDELLFGNLSDEISRERFQQLKNTGAGKVLTACPICYSNLRKDSSVQDLSTYLKTHLKI